MDGAIPVSAKARGKRKASEQADVVLETGTSKLKKSRSQKKEDKTQEREFWPEYFQELFKIFKAMNTVLAFCSSRKSMAIEFPQVRKTVESLINRPLDLSRVAEIKALLPDLIRFAYIPRDDLRINAEVQEQKYGGSKGRESSPDFSAFIHKSSEDSSVHGTSHEDEHVLVLEFISNKGAHKKPDNPYAFQLPTTLTPTAMKKLVEKRNERFVQAVEELLQVLPEMEDPVELLKSSAREHIPVNPSSVKSEQGHIPVSLQTIPDSKDRQSIDEVIEEIKTSDWYVEQIIDRRTFEAKEGREGHLNSTLSQTIKDALQASRKISSFYTHQAAAIDAVREGKHVIVSTSTASGKSVIYQVPMMRFLEENADAKAIYIYPTKALAQDQRGALEQLLWSCEGLQHVKVATYDGDTPMENRAEIRETASIIFTNFDMLHASILPHEENWRHFFKNLKLVAVDELHYYSGVFGSHAAYIMRRFRRVCAAVGNRRIRFVSCSATISNPLRHMKNIFGIDNVEVITDDGAPSGRKDFLVWNPSPKDPMDPSLGRHSAISEATKLMRLLMKKGVRTILFCKIRKMCELAMKTLRAELSAEGRLDILERVMAYRGGYSQHDRRKIEHEAFSGNLLGIVATNALELGVDIGVLDAVIMLGFPFGIASMRQQAGRAGRRARDALAVLVADSLPLDQHYVQHPDDLFNKNVDDLLIDLDGKVTLEAHLQCAAFEMPLTKEDAAYFGPRMLEICESRLVKDEDGWYHTNPKFLPYPSKHVSIRGIQEDMYTIVDVTNTAQPKILEEIEVSRLMFDAFEGAVFMHQGLTFLVQEVSHDSKIAKLVRADVNWTTKSRDFTDIDAIRTHRIREIKGSPIRAFYGKVKLKTIVFGFFKIRNNVILDTVSLEMPPLERDTTGFWIDVPKTILNIMQAKALNAAEAIHAAEHAFLNRFPMAADVKTECKVPVKEYMAAGTNRKRPARLIFYDAAGVQGTIAAKAFDHVSDLLHDAFETIESCDCQDGCANCIRSAYCKEGNVVSSKLGAQIVIRGILGLPIDMDSIPDSPESLADVPQSIVAAEPIIPVDGVEIEYYAD